MGDAAPDTNFFFPSGDSASSRRSCFNLDLSSDDGLDGDGSLVANLPSVDLVAVVFDSA